MFASVMASMLLVRQSPPTEVRMKCFGSGAARDAAQSVPFWVVLLHAELPFDAPAPFLLPASILRTVLV